MNEPAGPPPSLTAPLGPTPEVAQWVNQLTAILESQPRAQSIWCPFWAEHPEAVLRFTALHQSFLAMATEKELSSWWVNHFDRHAPFLFGPSGIFESCKIEHVTDRVYAFARRP